MPANVFISFELTNLPQVESIRALARNPKHELEFHDWSETETVNDKRGTPLPYPPDDPMSRAEPIRKELKRFLKKATKMVVLVGEYTHESKWVNWEIQTFYDMKSNLEGDPTKRIKAMYIQGCENPPLPKRVTGLNISTMRWKLSALNTWFNKQPNR